MEWSRDNAEPIPPHVFSDRKAGKFAFLVHLRSYREDLRQVARPLGWLPDRFYHGALSRRPLRPFVWSEVKVGSGPEETSGSIIMIPYSGKQLLDQSRQMMPVIRDAIGLAVGRGAEMIGLGGLISPVTLGGKLVAGAKGYHVTNGNAFTAVTVFRQLQSIIHDFDRRRPTVAIVGATGSVGSLVCRLLTAYGCHANLVLIARNSRKLEKLSDEITPMNGHTGISTQISDVHQADIVLLVTSDSGSLLQPLHLRRNCILLDATQPRNASGAILTQRPDVRMLDGGLVSIPSLQTNKVGRLGLPCGVSFACMAETILLAMSGYRADFSIGNPGLAHAAIIRQLSESYAHFGFDVAEDHLLGKPLAPFDAPVIS